MTTERLKTFIQDFTRLADAHHGNEPAMLANGELLLAGLVAHDDWLPEAFAQPNPERYTQYLLHCDPLERFSVVSFVWGPGQKTPVHDHMVWGLIGMLRGEEVSVPYVMDQGHLTAGDPGHLRPGMVDAVSPHIGDIHTVANALADRPSISIHLYGGNIGGVRRHVFVPETGEAKDFTSGYSATVLPNLWAS